MERRVFLGACAAALALGAPVTGRTELPVPHPRAKLIDERGRPWTAERLDPAITYIFHYPYESTPCFLLRLPEPVGPASREQSGGAGPEGRVVAYGAICTHLLTHPTPELAMIHYYPPGKINALAGRDRVIACCAHGSIFDPAAGGRVLDGPATAPLPSIVLEEDPVDGALVAVSVRGEFDYDHYLKTFRRELRRTYGRRRYKALVGPFVEALPLEAFSAEVVDC